MKAALAGILTGMGTFSGIGALLCASDYVGFTHVGDGASIPLITLLWAGAIGFYISAFNVAKLED